MKKLMSLLLVLTMILAMVPVVDADNGPAVYYKIPGPGATITEFNADNFGTPFQGDSLTIYFYETATSTNALDGTLSVTDENGNNLSYVTVTPQNYPDGKCYTVTFGTADENYQVKLTFSCNGTQYASVTTTIMKNSEDQGGDNGGQGNSGPAVCFCTDPTSTDPAPTYLGTEFTFTPNNREFYFAVIRNDPVTITSESYTEGEGSASYVDVTYCTDGAIRGKENYYKLTVNNDAPTNEPFVYEFSCAGSDFEEATTFSSTITLKYSANDDDAGGNGNSNNPGPPVDGFYTEQTSTTAVTTAEYSIESGLTLYYKTADGYTADQLQNLTVEIDRKQIEGLTVDKVLRYGSENRYDIKIVIPSGLGMYKEGNILQLNGSNFGNYITLTCNDGLSQNPDGSSPSLLAEFDVNGTTYAIGFVGYNGNDKVLRDDVGIGHEVFDGGPKTIINNLEISAGKKETSGEETNYPAIDVDESILRWEVTKLYIADMNGTRTFSFDDEESITSLTDLEDNKDMPDVYGLDYSFNSSKVVAELNVYINGATEPQEAVIYIGIGQMVVSSDVVERPENDDVNALNAWLANNSTEGVVLIKLGKEYNGTIQIPEGVNRYKFVGHEDCTIIKGGINLNGGSTTISARENIDIPNEDFSYGAVHFVAPDSANNGGVTSAIFGGSSSTVDDCTFYGYDVAVDCSGGFIALENYNIFVNNDVAVRIDLKSATNKSYNQGTWMRNTFINNGTAIKIVSLNDEIISPFEFRVSHCNFIHNKVDVDTNVEGTFYFYDNYYGRRKGIDFGQKHGKNGHSLDELNLTGMLGAKSESGREGFYEDSYKREKQADDRDTFNRQITGSATIIISRASEKPIKGWWRMCNHLNHHPKGDRPQPNSENQIALLSSDEEYSDNYIAIWTVETEIINKDADNLVMDDSSFVDSQGEPVETEVAVVEADKTSSVLLGTWIFGKTITEDKDGQTYIVSNSADASSEGFNAKLTINRTDDEITVEVVESTVLETLKPLLTVPCDFEHAVVTFNGTKLENVTSDGENVTFTVAEAGTYVISPATTYEVTLDAKGGTIADGKNVTSYVEGVGAKLPTADDMASDDEDYVFDGWYDNEVYSGDPVTEISKDATGDKTFYAKWKQVYFSVSATIKTHDNDGYIGEATIKLKRGNDVIETGTASNGNVTFKKHVAAGMYNLVAIYEDKAGEHTKTELIEVNHNENYIIALPAPGVNSHLEVNGGSNASGAVDASSVMVGGLDDEATSVKSEKPTADKVSVSMTVDGKTEAQVEDSVVDNIQDKIAESYNETGNDGTGGETPDAPEVVVEYLEITITKEVVTGSESETSTIAETSNIIEIVVPFSFDGRTAVKVFRHHGEGENATAEELTKCDVKPGYPIDGHYWLDETNGYIHIYTNKFSTYAIAYTTEGDDTTGGEGDGNTGSDTPGEGDTDRPIVPVISPAIIPGIADIILGGKTDVVKRPASVKVDVMDSVVALDTIETQSSSKIVFTDVAEADWFCGDVMSLVHKGIISGYPDGSFRPQGEVTWGEALKLVLLASRYGQQAPTGDHWASGYMDLAIKLGFISDPVTLDAPITRGEMADLTAAAMKLSSANISNPFDDEAPASALALYEAGIIKGSADNGKLLYRAESTITRAEMAAIIWRVYCAK